MNKCKQPCPDLNMVTPFGTLTNKECLTYTPKLNIDGDYIINSKNGVYFLKPLLLNDTSGGNTNATPTLPDGVFNQVTVNKGKVSYQTVAKHTYQQKDNIDCCDGGSGDSSVTISSDANNQLTNATDGLMAYCKVIAGANTSVTGSGTGSNPYVISSMGGGSSGSSTVINDLTSMLDFTATSNGINVTFKEGITLDKLTSSTQYTGERNIEVDGTVVKMALQELTDSSLRHVAFNKALSFDKTGVLTGVELLETEEVKTIEFKNKANVDISIEYKKIGGFWNITNIS